MPAKRLSMRQVKEVLRLKWACGLSDRQIAHSLRISRPTVADYVRRAKDAGLSWPLPEDLGDDVLERLVHNAYKILLKGESMRKQRASLTAETSSM
jgi:DNA-binding transcriptional regulator LsrR (DeoR family)